MDNSENTIKTILKEIRAKENGPAMDAMNRMGLKYKRNFGVSLFDLKIIAAKYKPNHNLSATLRIKDIRETKILAEMIEDPKTVSEHLADNIVSGIDTNELAEQACLNLFENLEFAGKKAFEWIHSGHEYTIVCGFILLSRIALKDKQKDDDFFIKSLLRSETLAENESIFIRKAIARSLRQIALRNDKLKKQVLNTTDKLKENKSEYSKLVVEEVVPLISF